jgi:hypothetical protein
MQELAMEVMMMMKMNGLKIGLKMLMLLQLRKNQLANSVESTELH